MSDFTKAINIILQHEGGFVDNSSDPGGATCRGITLNFMIQHPIDCDFNKDGVVDKLDLMSMTIQEASSLYQKYWWEWYHYGNITDNTIATKTFDFSVNMGAKRAHELLQQSMNSALNANIVVDGDLGPMTMSTLNNVTTIAAQQSLISTYSNQVWSFYQTLITHNPTLSVFSSGWKNRAFSVNRAGMIS